MCNMLVDFLFKSIILAFFWICGSIRLILFTRVFPALLFTDLIFFYITHIWVDWFPIFCVLCYCLWLKLVYCHNTAILIVWKWFYYEFLMCELHSQRFCVFEKSELYIKAYLLFCDGSRHLVWAKVLSWVIKDSFIKLSSVTKIFKPLCFLNLFLYICIIHCIYAIFINWSILGNGILTLLIFPLHAVFSWKSFRHLMLTECLT